jgi:hypothetical protein
VKALRVCFSTAISSSAFNSKKFSHHRGASDVANNVAHHTMLPTMSITMLADISMRLRKRHDTQIHHALIFRASIVSGVDLTFATPKSACDDGMQMLESKGPLAGRFAFRRRVVWQAEPIEPWLQPGGMMALVLRNFDFTNPSPIRLL